MANIDELERRLSAAFERIGAGVEALDTKWATPVPAPEPEVDPEELAALRAELEAAKTQLEEERTANNQLEERVKVLSARQASEVAGLEAHLSETKEMMLSLDSEVQRLKQACDILRENNESLRKANEGNVGEPHLINRSLLAELEALRAQRATDRAEIESVLSALGPLLQEAAEEVAAIKEETA